MDSDDHPRPGHPRYDEATALEVTVRAIRHAQGKKNPTTSRPAHPNGTPRPRIFCALFTARWAAILLIPIIQTDRLPTVFRTRVIKIIRQNSRLQNYFHRVRIRARPAISGRSVSPSRGYACGFFFGSSDLRIDRLWNLHDCRSNDLDFDEWLQACEACNECKNKQQGGKPVAADAKMNRLPTRR
jgi:hypothetical protein